MLSTTSVQRPTIKLPVYRRPSPIAARPMMFLGEPTQKRLCLHPEMKSPLSGVSFGNPAPMSALVNSALVVRPVPRKPLTPVLSKR